MLMMAVVRAEEERKCRPDSRLPSNGDAWGIWCSVLVPFNGALVGWHIREGTRGEARFILDVLC